MCRAGHFSSLIISLIISWPYGEPRCSTACSSRTQSVLAYKSPLKCMDKIIFNIWFQNTDFLTAVPINLIRHAFRKMFQFPDRLYLMFLPRANFEIFGKKNPRKFPIKMDERNLWLLFSKFYFKILILQKQFPVILLNMHLEKCFDFLMYFSWCFYLGPILRYLWQQKSQEKSPLKCMGEIYGCFSVFYFKILILQKQFPFIWLNMHLEKSFNFMMDLSWCFYTGPILRYLCQQKSPKNSPLKCMDKSMVVFHYFISKCWFSDSSSHSFDLTCI